jgi:hypothetical protein
MKEETVLIKEKYLFQKYISYNKNNIVKLK